MQKYVPINCSYYDELEAFATLRQSVTIVYENFTTKETETIKTRILNFYIRDKVEFMVLENGADIRLDALISVDGKVPPLAC